MYDKASAGCQKPKIPNLQDYSISLVLAPRNRGGSNAIALAVAHGHVEVRHKLLQHQPSVKSNDMLSLQEILAEGRLSLVRCYFLCLFVCFFLFLCLFVCFCLFLLFLFVFVCSLSVL